MTSYFYMTQDEKNNQNKKTLLIETQSSPLSSQELEIALDQKITSLQTELEQNPKSLAFSQLADFYLQKKLYSEAEALLQKGLRYHPQSVSAMVVLAKIEKHHQRYDSMISILTKAIQLAPQNWQAYLLRATAYSLLNKHKSALDDFKKVTLFNPTNLVANKAIAKIDLILSQTDDSASDQQDFEAKNIADIPSSIDSPPNKFSETLVPQMTNTPLAFEMTISPQLERVLSVIDAFIQRNDMEKALKLLYECKSEFGNHTEIENRLLRLSQFENAEKIRPKGNALQSKTKAALIIEKKKNTLELLLRRIIEIKQERLVQP